MRTRKILKMKTTKRVISSLEIANRVHPDFATRNGATNHKQKPGRYNLDPQRQIRSGSAEVWMEQCISKAPMRSGNRPRNRILRDERINDQDSIVGVWIARKHIWAAWSLA